jgi:ubiquinone/menaquinone biosynthesis C-methylase UbiE
MMKNTAQENATLINVSQHFDRLALSYDSKSLKRETYLRAVDGLIVTHLLEYPAQSPKILDVGTGSGSRALKLKEALGSAEIVGCDISPQMVEIARSNGMDVALADMSELPYRDSSFDHLLVLFNVFGYAPSEHMRKMALQEFYRVLKSGGTVSIDILNRWHRGEGRGFSKTRLSIFKELAKSVFSSSLELGDVTFTPNPSQSHQQGFFHSFSDNEARRLFLGAGFNLKDCRIIGYDSGTYYEESSKGNLFYTLEKPTE